MCIRDRFKGKSTELIVKQGEKFYISMGMPHLPQSFWDKSDLYSLPADSPRKKNTHASAWHLDLDKDIRSLMNVESMPSGSKQSIMNLVIRITLLPIQIPMFRYFSVMVLILGSMKEWEN